MSWDKLYNLDKTEAAFETGSIIGIRIKKLWEETTDGGKNVDFCKLLKYVKTGIIDYIIHNLDKCEKITNCPLLFEGYFCTGDTKCYHVDVKRIFFNRSKKALSWDSAKPIDRSEAKKYTRYKDFSAIFLVIIKSLYDAYNEYYSDHI
ncbi:MAG: hypothetical protein F7C36_00230 [Desulfurococcales archaeon]|nr:hypothetical protein [Desulfurococcales archaeon]